MGSRGDKTISLDITRLFLLLKRNLLDFSKTFVAVIENKTIANHIFTHCDLINMVYRMRYQILKAPRFIRNSCLLLSSSRVLIDREAGEDGPERPSREGMRRRSNRDDR